MTSSESEEPFNFSWAIPGLLAGSGFPRSLANLQFLVDAGVDILVTLNAERKPPVDAFRKRASTASAESAAADAPTAGSHHPLEWLSVDIVDFATPTRRQIDLVMDAVDRGQREGKKVCIHCTMGRGRTGTMIACWLARSRRLSGEEAVRLVRQIRPGSIETDGQENAVREYAKENPA